MQKWSKDTIAAEIRKMAAAGEPLNYARVAHQRVALLRAATRYFGSWWAAVEFAGLDYIKIRRYNAWSPQAIVERIRELHARGEDLSWRYVSTVLDPQLAAAATKKKHFGSWRAAIEAAGIDYETVRRYKRWNEETIVRRLRDLYAQGVDLNAKSMEEQNISLITAARRRFGSWDRALTAAGLDYQQICLRRPYRRRRPSAVRSEADTATVPIMKG
ncbi:MAG: homing endonuclease associated repeat-containing protein [Chthonomonadales bacterium]